MVLEGHPVGSTQDYRGGNGRNQVLGNREQEVRIYFCWVLLLAIANKRASQEFLSEKITEIFPTLVPFSQDPAQDPTFLKSQPLPTATEPKPRDTCLWNRSLIKKPRKPWEYYKHFIYCFQKDRKII